MMPVKLKAIVLNAPNEDSHPASIRVYANTGNLDFGDAESREPHQRFEIEQNGEEKVLPLKPIKFGTVNKVTIFIESNHGGETSKIHNLSFMGLTKSATEV